METGKNRSSILKPQKPRNPLSDVDLIEPIKVETPVRTRRSSLRRVSFASSNYVKEFATDTEKNTTMWNTTYEEKLNKSDSTHSQEITHNPSDTHPVKQSELDMLCITSQHLKQSSFITCNEVVEKIGLIEPNIYAKDIKGKASINFNEQGGEDILSDSSLHDDSCENRIIETGTINVNTVNTAGQTDVMTFAQQIPIIQNEQYARSAENSKGFAKGSSSNIENMSFANLFGQPKSLATIDKENIPTPSGPLISKSLFSHRKFVLNTDSDFSASNKNRCIVKLRTALENDNVESTQQFLASNKTSNMKNVGINCKNTAEFTQAVLSFGKNNCENRTFIGATEMESTQNLQSFNKSSYGMNRTTVTDENMEITQPLPVISKSSEYSENKTIIMDENVEITHQLPAFNRSNYAVQNKIVEDVNMEFTQQLPACNKSNCDKNETVMADESIEFTQQVPFINKDGSNLKNRFATDDDDNMDFTQHLPLSNKTNFNMRNETVLQIDDVEFTGQLPIAIESIRPVANSTTVGEIDMEFTQVQPIVPNMKSINFGEQATELLPLNVNSNNSINQSLAKGDDNVNKENSDAFQIKTQQPRVTNMVNNVVSNISTVTDNDDMKIIEKETIITSPNVPSNNSMEPIQPSVEEVHSEDKDLVNSLTVAFEQVHAFKHETSDNPDMLRKSTDDDAPSAEHVLEREKCNTIRLGNENINKTETELIIENKKTKEIFKENILIKQNVSCNNFKTPRSSIGPEVHTDIKNERTKEKLKEASGIKQNINCTPGSSFQMNFTPCSPGMDDTQHLINYSLTHKRSKSDFSKIITGDLNPSFLSSKFMPLSEFSNDAFPVSLETSRNNQTHLEHMQLDKVKVWDVIPASDATTPNNGILERKEEFNRDKNSSVLSTCVETIQTSQRNFKHEEFDRDKNSSALPMCVGTIQTSHTNLKHEEELDSDKNSSDLPTCQTSLEPIQLNEDKNSDAYPVSFDNQTHFKHIELNKDKTCEEYNKNDPIELDKNINCALLSLSHATMQTNRTNIEPIELDEDKNSNTFLASLYNQTHLEHVELNKDKTCEEYNKNEVSNKELGKLKRRSVENIETAVICKKPMLDNTKQNEQNATGIDDNRGEMMEKSTIESRTINISQEDITLSDTVASISDSFTKEAKELISNITQSINVNSSSNISTISEHQFSTKSKKLEEIYKKGTLLKQKVEDFREKMSGGLNIVTKNLIVLQEMYDRELKGLSRPFKQHSFEEIKGSTDSSVECSLLESASGNMVQEEHHSLFRIDSNLTTDIETDLTLKEKVEQKQKRCKRYWRLLFLEGDKCEFDTFYKTIRLAVQLDPQTGIVNKIDVCCNISDDSEPTALFVHKIFKERVSQKIIQSAVGEQYDILTLLDYVHLNMQKMLEIMNELDEFEKRFCLKMDRNFRVTFKIISIPLRSTWCISVDMSDVENITEDSVTAYAKIGTVKETEIKSFVEGCPRGLLFLRSFINNILGYVQLLQKRKTMIKTKAVDVN